MNFIAGSATTYQGKPQSFNVMHLDPVTMLPVEFETYAFDLDHANKYDEPKWDLKYNYTQVYDMPDLSPKSFFAHSSKIFFEEDAAKQYRNHRYIDGPGVDTTSECNIACRRIMYCQTVSNDYDEWQYCLDNDRFQPFSVYGLLSIENLIDKAWYEKKQE